MKVLIADKLSEAAVSALRGLGAEVTVNADLTADDLPNSIGDANVLVVRSTKVTAATVAAGANLDLIIRAGAGVNTIDLAAASKAGIHVANCPGKNTDAVAELALGLLIAADRRIVDASVDLRNGKWRKKEYGKAAGLKDRTLGIIGLGMIGKALAKRAQALEMNVIAWSRSLTPEAAEEMDITYCDSPEAVVREADAISVHLAATPETKGMFDAKLFSKMKDGAIFVNTSRGEVVDAQALRDAIDKKGLRVGLDVFADEPAGGEAAFEQRELAGMIACTPHVGASTDQAAQAIADEVVAIVRSYKQTGKPANTVNVRDKSDADISLVVRHYNKVGVLAGVLDALREANINVEEMENTIFSGGEVALCVLRIDTAPDVALLKKIGEAQTIIHASVK